MNALHAIILGIVEGFTEYLPVSSTGHLILVSRILGIAQSDFVKSFEIAIQLGAILAAVVLYWRKLLGDWEIMKRIAIAFLPTAVVGLALYKIIKTYLLGSSAVTLWALLIGGVMLIIFELFHQEKSTASAEIGQVSYRKAFLIGAFQSIAIVPGVSRSAATIVGGLLLGMKRQAIVEFSFLLAVPTMLAATGLDLVKSFNEFNSDQFGVLSIGFVVSFIVAIIGIKFLISFVKNHTFISFGIYRILAAAAFFFLIF